MFPLLRVENVEYLIQVADDAIFAAHGAYFNIKKKIFPTSILNNYKYLKNALMIHVVLLSVSFLFQIRLKY